MLMMFAGMDFITRLYDEAADLFKAVTVGIKRDELLDFVKLCREVATRANEVVQIIDEAGKDAMSMAYAEMEDGIGERLLDELRQHVDDYGKSPAGRKYFYGDHLK
jgi:phosphopantetheine adenylyltransferase